LNQPNKEEVVEKVDLDEIKGGPEDEN